MRFAQVDWKFIDGQEPDNVAAELDLSADEVIGKAVRMWRWSQVHAAPDGVVRGAGAVASIERAAGWTGRRGRWVAAMTRAEALSTVKDGVSFRGWVERYGNAEERARARSEKARKAAAARWGKHAPVDAQKEPSNAPSNARSIAPSIQNDALSNAKKLETPEAEAFRRPAAGAAQDFAEEPSGAGSENSKPPPPPADGGELRVVPDDAPAEQPAEPAQGSPEEFWAWAQNTRAEVLPEAVRETAPDGYAAWARGVIAEVGTYRLSCAYQAFLLDEDFQRKSCPFRIFMSDKVWRHRAHDPPMRRRRL